ncbi:MAG TPA: GAF domain-containing protein [Kofleriaceae bacterium]
MVDSTNAVRIHVHDDTRVLDGMLRLVDVATRQRPIDDTLAEMCQLISEIAGVDVVSVYLREQLGGREMLVMRGNVGFPADAVRRVQLGLYEGLTGVVAGRRRPVTVAVAQQDDRYKHVDGIGEEQFAAYLGVPLLVADEVAGVLVFQRRAPGAFTENDVSLASSLMAPLILVIERNARAHAGTTYQLGTSVVRGHAIGPALVIPSPSDAPKSVAAALHALDFDLVTAAQRLGHAGPVVARALDNLSLVATALRDQVASRSGDVLAKLQRVPYHATSGDKDLTSLISERDREVGELWSFLLSDMQHRLPICGAVLVARSLGTFMALEAVARGAAAVVVAESVTPAARDVLEAAGVPAMTDVQLPENAGVDCTLLEVDATRGTVRVLARTV